MISLSSSKTEFIEFLLQCHVLKFGDFITKSGRETPYFINTGNFSTGGQLKRLGKYYAAAIQKNFGDSVTNLFGPAYKGIPLATAVGIGLDEDYQKEVTVSFDRKEVKDHGEGGWMLGYNYQNSKNGENIVIVEDVTTAGTSIKESMPKLTSFPKNKVIGLVVSVDRMERGEGTKSALAELEELFGIKTVSLISFKDLIQYLEENAESRGIEAKVLEAMKAYREKYAGL